MRYLFKMGANGGKPVHDKTMYISVEICQFDFLYSFQFCDMNLFAFIIRDVTNQI